MIEAKIRGFLQVTASQESQVARTSMREMLVQGKLCGFRSVLLDSTLKLLA